VSCEGSRFPRPWHFLVGVSLALHLRASLGRVFLARKRLIREGPQAQAVVIDAVVHMLDGAAPGSYDLALRVHFPDGVTSEVSRRADAADVGIVSVGDTLPIRYDAEDRSKVEIDVPTFRRQREAEQQRANDAAIANAEAALGAPGARPPTRPELFIQVGRELAEIKQAHAAGALTDEEFEARKTELKARLED
jgi:hypothetical protein